MEKMPALSDVYRALVRIKPMIRKTPLIGAADLALTTGAKSVHLKLESQQETGAFKVRGAANKILSLGQKELQKGVITFSTGNHGKAVAYVAGRLGVKATVCLSERVDGRRVAAIKKLGAEVSVRGASQDEAEINYRDQTASRGLVPVVPFDDPLIIAGQGTIALEILTGFPDTDVLLVPLSGGGLLSGIAMAAKSINPDIRIVGLSLERSPAMIESLKAGKPVQVPERPSVAESLLGGIGVDNRYTLPMIGKYVDDHLLISEAEIQAGMYYLFDVHRTIAEGAAALGVGAMLSRRIDVIGKSVVALVTGSSIDPAAYLKIIEQEMERKTSR